MNFLAICQQLADEADIPRSGLTDVENVTGELSDVVRWARDAYTDIQTQQDGKWKFLHSEYERRTRATMTLDAGAAVDNGGGTVDIPITAHGFFANDYLTLRGTTNYDGTYLIAVPDANTVRITATYTAETFAGTEKAFVQDYEFLVADSIQAFDHNQFYYYQTSLGANNRCRLKYCEFEEFKRKYYDYSVTDAPAAITITPNKRLRVYPAPDTVYTLQGEAFSTPQILAVNADTPSMPANFHNMIVWKALLDYAGHEEAGSPFQWAAMRFDEKYNQLLWQEKYETELMVVRPA